MASTTQGLVYEQTLGYEINPAQQLVVPHVDEEKNLLVSFPTSAGKTLCINMLAYKYLYGTTRKRLMYVAPMKALVEEKKRDWTDEKHPYNEFNLVIVTGDYVGTWEDDKTVAAADIIVITPESLASRLRNIDAAKSKLLENIGLLVIDEVHLLDEEGRGATLEAALLEFTTENPNVPILALSATVPNVEEIGGWLGSLNKLPTEIIVSDWRPTKLYKHYYPIHGKDYDGSQRIEACKRIRAEHPDKSFIYGVFAKTFGTKLEKAFRSEDVPIEFHNADKQKDTKDKIERDFRLGKIKDLVATKTLAVGMNLPAGHVVVTAASNAGGDIRAYELNQFAGRAGRPQFESEGHAHFLLPANEFDYHVNRIENGEPVCSQLKTADDVALHFLGAMYIGRIRTPSDFFVWFQRTLRNFQNPIPLLKLHEILDDIVQEMVTRGMITKEDNGSLKLRKRGMICAQMGISPYYLFELVCNFQKYLAFPNPNDIALARALGECSEFYSPIYVNTAPYFDIPTEIEKNTSNGYMQAVAAYYLAITGQEVPATLWNMTSRTKYDIDRIGLILDRLNYETECWKDPRIGLVPYRVYYGVSFDVAYLIAQGCSKALAQKLMKNGIRNVTDLKENPTLAKQLCTAAQLKALKVKV